jgi:hypothetical protein
MISYEPIIPPRPGGDSVGHGLDRPRTWYTIQEANASARVAPLPVSPLTCLRRGVRKRRSR